jgi:hypothetical protein
MMIDNGVYNERGMYCKYEGSSKKKKMSPYDESGR